MEQTRLPRDILVGVGLVPLDENDFAGLGLNPSIPDQKTMLPPDYVEDLDLPEMRQLRGRCVG